MTRKINVTVVSAAAMLFIAVAVWLLIPYGIAETTSAVDVGPRAFPQLVCKAMAALSVLQLILVGIGATKSKYIEVRFSEQIPVYIAMALSILAVLCMLYVNVILAAVLCAVAFLAILKAKNWKYYAAVALTGIILFLLMRLVMHIRF